MDRSKRSSGTLLSQHESDVSRDELVGGTSLFAMDWRFCERCAAMFFDDRPDKESCPAGGGHQASGFNFVLDHP
jgi:hypothetical protein